MKRHPLDPFSLIAGCAFITVAALYLIASLQHFSVNGRVVVPLTLIALGTAGLAGAVTAMTRRGRSSGPAEAAPPAPESADRDKPVDSSTGALTADLEAMGLLDKPER